MVQGGTIIGSARCMDFKERDGRRKAAANLIEHGICNIVCIGGDGSLAGAEQFKEDWTELKCEAVQAGNQPCEASNWVSKGTGVSG